MTTTIDRAGRVVIPKDLRKRAGLRPGAELEIDEVGGVIEIKMAPPSGSMVSKGRWFVWRSAPGTPPVTQEEINKAIQDVREERERRIIEGLTGEDRNRF